MLIQADLTEIEFPACSFDAVTAFTSLMHVPRDYHGQILRNIAVWLRPGGLFLASLGTRGAAEQWEDDWLGAPMFWSHHEPDHLLELVGSAGLNVERDWYETLEDGIDGPEAFYWVLASRPVS